jgi:hypothetical protein
VSYVSQSKTGNVRNNVTLRRVRELFLPLKSNEYCILVCVCVSAGECVRVPGRVGVCLHVALLIQHATRIRYIVKSFVVPVAPPFFSALSHKRHYFRGKKKKGYLT